MMESDEVNMKDRLSENRKPILISVVVIVSVVVIFLVYITLLYIFLGSEKDIEDARFLFKLFEENLNTGELLDYIRPLEIPVEEAKYYLGWKE